MLFAVWFGWTLDYTDRLPYAEVVDILAMRLGESKAHDD